MCKTDEGSPSKLSNFIRSDQQAIFNKFKSALQTSLLIILSYKQTVFPQGLLRNSLLLVMFLLLLARVQLHLLVQQFRVFQLHGFLVTAQTPKLKTPVQLLYSSTPVPLYSSNTKWCQRYSSRTISSVLPTKIWATYTAFKLKRCEIQVLELKHPSEAGTSNT